MGVAVSVITYSILALLFLPCLLAIRCELWELFGHACERFGEEDLDEILERRVKFHSIARVARRLHDDIESEEAA